MKSIPAARTRTGLPPKTGSTLWRSAATFKEHLTEKLSFIFLNQLDLGLTLVAFNMRLTEVNPIMATLLRAGPFPLLIVKVAIPILIAWLVPGRLLIPAVALLMVVVGLDIRAIIIYVSSLPPPSP